jgi:hypothetical protein
MATRSRAHERSWRRAATAVLTAGALIAPSSVLAGEGGAPDRSVVSAPPEKPAPPKPGPAKPAAPALTCTLLTIEAPRGGLLEVEGAGFGKAPLVRIAGRVTRMIERTETKISVQIHPDSNGGAVTVHAGKLEAACGTLTIIGKNG